MVKRETHTVNGVKYRPVYVYNNQFLHYENDDDVLVHEVVIEIGALTGFQASWGAHWGDTRDSFEDAVASLELRLSSELSRIQHTLRILRGEDE